MLIAFEGLDQSGKETQTRHLRARLEQDGHKVRAASFPDYGTPIGHEIQLALSGERDFGPEVMQLLYVANRFEYKPRLDLWLTSGDIVVCDRFRASTVAYGEAQGVDPEWLDLIQRALPEPTLTVLLDIEPRAAIERKRTGRDRFERDMSLLERVRDSYRRQAASAPSWVVIDAARPPDDVAADVQRHVLSRLERASTRSRS
jgi:dTMP kinase